MISLEDFQEYMSQHGKSENTIKTYLGHVKGYALWYEESYGREMTKLYHTNILDYRSYLQNIKRLKFNSINAKLSALSCFNHFLIETKGQEDAAVVSEDRLKFQQMIASPSDLDKPEVDEFLQRVLVETGKRNYAMATLLAYAGLRVSECTDLLLTNLDLQARELIVIGKGNKQRIVFINDKIIHAVREYLKERNSDCEYLFVSRKGGKLHRSSVNRFFSQCSDRINPHKLRHFFCSHALKCGYSIPEVANQAGHSSERTTLLYTNTSRKEMKEKANLL